MWFNLFVGFTLLFLSVFVQAIATKFTMTLAIKYSHIAHLKSNMKVFWTSIIVLIMFAASLIESFIWAITYLFIGAIEHFEEAIYFSIVTFTTLGYGDVTLSETYRLLASLQAASGIIIFGWSTAIIIAAVQKFYFGDLKPNKN